MSLDIHPLRLTLEGAPRALLIQLTDAREAETLDQTLGHLRALTGGGFAHAALAVDEWNADLSPWPAPAAFGREGFAGQGRDTLDALLNGALPLLRAALAEQGAPDRLPVCLGGYSLAGLFALWAAYEGAPVGAVAAASPSVWLPGWDAYADARPAPACPAYLSLGRREPKARNPLMAAVGGAIERQCGRFLAAGVPCALEWNEGNHFTEPELRTAKAFAWAIENMKVEDKA